MDRMVESEERPANESPVPAALSDPGVASPEKSKVKKRRMSFKKLRSNAQKLIPRRKKNDNKDGPEAEQSSTELLSEPSLPPAVSPSAPSAPSSPTLTVSSELVTSSESIPAATELQQQQQQQQQQRQQQQSKESLMSGSKSDEKLADEPIPKKKSRKPSRAASFMKKLTGRKAKVAPNLPIENEVDTSGGTLETPLSIKRSTPEGATLSISETSLYDEPADQSDDQVKILELDAEPKPQRKPVGGPLRRPAGDTVKASSGFQLPSPQRATGNTAPSGADNGGPAAGVGEPMARSSVEPAATDSKPISAERSPTTVGLVTAANVPPDFGESSTPSSKLAAAPVPAPNLSRAFIAEIDKLSVENVTGSQPTIRDKFFQSVTAGSGQETFMRAQEETQQQQQQPPAQAQQPPSPGVTTVRTQEAARPYQLGNNLRNPNNGGNFETAGAAGTPPEPSDAQDAIVFDIGTKVRANRTSTIKVTTTTLTPLAVDSVGLASPSRDRSGSFGLSGSKSIEDDGSRTPDADGSFASDYSRRRLAYVAQPTLYTPEEEELLVGKPSLVSSVTSDYSLESDDYLENKMSPHGDLLLEKADANAANMNAAPVEKREHLYKILVIGELGTGKTSFIKRYVHQFFSQNYRATIGVDFALKVLNWDQNTIIRLQLWDIAGQERFGNMTRVYYKEAVGAFIVFDVTRSATFDAVIKWKQDLDSKVQLPDGKPIPCILLANKNDQQKQGIVATPAKLDEYVKEHGFAGWFETSAKENVNIEEAAKSLVNKILMNDKAINAGELMDAERFALAGGQLEDAQKKSCAC